MTPSSKTRQNAPWVEPEGNLRVAVLSLIGKGVPPVQAAQTGGFQTLAGFASALQKHWGLRVKGSGSIHGALEKGEFTLEYGGDFHIERTLAYLGRDPCNASERVTGNVYSRWFPVAGKDVLVTITLKKKNCWVETGKLSNQVQWLELVFAIRRFLGLDQPLTAFYQVASSQKAMAPLVAGLPGVRIPQVPTLWEALCWAVLGQQINLAFAYRLRNRLIRLGHDLPADDVMTSEEMARGPANGAKPLVFPSPEQILCLDPAQLQTHQFSRQKANYLGQVARACLEGPLRDLSLSNVSPQEAEERMLAVKGIGRWSAAYGLMRGLGYMDALPVGDAGLRTALRRFFSLPEAPDIAEQEHLMEPFRPFRSLACYYLWKSLGTTTDG